MRAVEGRMILEPQLTAFQVSILTDMVTAKYEVAAAEARTSPEDVASWVATMVEYDQILRALKEEKDLHDDHIRPKLRGKRA